MPGDVGAMIRDIVVPGVPVVEKILRPIVVYTFLVLLLRIAGHRTLGQMNTFDLVVLLTLSNTVQNAIIGNDNSVSGGVIGAATLVAVNWLVVRHLYRHPRLDRALEGEPLVLVERGRFVRGNLARALITEDELMAAVRRQGASELAEVERVILETSGTISVLLHHPTQEEVETAAVLARLDRLEASLRGGPARDGR